MLAAERFTEEVPVRDRCSLWCRWSPWNQFTENSHHFRLTDGSRREIMQGMQKGKKSVETVLRRESMEATFEANVHTSTFRIVVCGNLFLVVR